MPRHSSDLNLAHMTGASNKPFDYMAAGLALLVSDRPDWRDMFVAPGYARACDPTDPASIAAALTWFLDHPAERRAMGASGRAKIAAEWNYDSAFAPVMSALRMDEGGLAFDLIRRVVRAVPDRLRGKTRLARSRSAVSQG